MDFLQILAGMCSEDMLTLLSLVKWAIKIICWVIPVILIVMTIADLAKVVTAGSIDDKMKKEVSQKVLTRLIYSLLIFLIPIIVNLIFSLLPSRVTSSGGYDASWWECWGQA